MPFQCMEMTENAIIILWSPRWIPRYKVLNFFGLVAPYRGIDQTQNGFE